MTHTEIQPANAQSILIVDDDPDICRLLELLFQDAGYRTAVVHAGEEAIEWVKTTPPDLVVLDILMPGMDGWETFQEIHELSNLPVLFLSALSSGEHAARALRLGAKDFIRKPFHIDELLARTAGLLQAAPPQARRSPRLADQRPSVSVVIPTLNEAGNLPLVLPYLPQEWIDEVILVDGRSTDRTVEVARRLLPSIRVVYEKRPGKGAALQAGYRAASGEVIVVVDADGSHDPREIPRFVQALMQGADFAKGSRFTPGGGTTDMPRVRKLGNGSFVHLVNLLFSCKFTDLCYGYHAFWRYCLDVIDLSEANGFEIDTAIYLKALKGRLRIVEIPSFEGYRFHGEGKLKTIPDGVRVLRTIGLEWLGGLGAPEKNHIGFRGQPAAANQAVRVFHQEEA